MEDYIIFTVILGTYILAGVSLGWYIGARGAKLWLPAALLALALTVFKTYLSYRPEIETALFPFADYIYFSTWNTFTASALILIVARVTRNRGARIRIALFALLGIVGLMHNNLPYFARARLNDIGDNVDSSGLVLQTTRYSCTPAAMATLLHSIGMETSEKEMARLSLTRPFFGTTLLGTYRALKIKAGQYGLKVRIVRCDKQRLRSLRKPLLLWTKFDNAHTNVLFAQSGDTLLIAEPESGFEFWNINSIDDYWYGIAVVLYRSSVEEEPRFFFRPALWEKYAYSPCFQKFHSDYMMQKHSSRRRA